MKSSFFRIVASLSLGLPCPVVWAAIKPSFALDYSIWRATDIAVATEGEVIDGRLRVLERWKGALKAGEELLIPELSAFAAEESRRIHSFGQRPSDQAASGQRMILFLFRANADAITSPANATSPAWEPASYLKYGGFSTAVAWVEKGWMYSFVQRSNPGPSLLQSLDVGEVEAKARVASYVVIQEALDDATARQSPDAARLAFEAFHRNHFGEAANASIDAMASMGPGAIATLKEMLTKRTLGDWHDSMVVALARIDSSDVAPILTGVLEQEVTFWKERAPAIESGWWNADPPGRRQEMRNHYNRMMRTLETLAEHPSPGSRESVRQLLAVWKANPNTGTLREGVMERCESVLAQEK